MAAPAEKPVKDRGDKGSGQDAMSDAEIDRLTDKVYRLMMQDARMEHARSSRGGT